MLICTLGDLLLDVVVRPGSPPETGDDRPAEIHVTGGGQAANVAAWAAALGAQAKLVTKRGQDAAGRLLAAELAAGGVEVVGPAGGRTGAVVSLVSADGERALLSDRGSAPELRPEELEMRWFQGCDVLHLSGYALLGGPVVEAGAKAAGAVRAVGGRISVDLIPPGTFAEIGTERLVARLSALEPDVLFAGDSELAALGATPEAGTVVIKRGAAGFEVVRNGRSERYEARAAQVVDTTGAGDALAAGFLVGGVEAGLDAAARCVATPGARP
jgi:sugar/nucleoside kinase (ribokinase family)